MSLLTALQTLAGLPITAGQNRNHERDRTLAAANHRRFELETALGLPVSAPSIGATRLSAEIAELETKLAAKNPAAPTATTAPAAPAPVAAKSDTLQTEKLTGLARAAASFRAEEKAAIEQRKAAAAKAESAQAAAIKGLMPTEKLAALCAHLFNGPATYEGDPDTRAKCLSQLRQAGVEIPNLEPAKHKVELTGFHRTIAATYQAKADEYLAQH
jgi:hypothetical protein